MKSTVFKNDPIVAGCDVGSLTAKAVILAGNRIIGKKIIRSKPRPEDSAKRVMAEAMDDAGVTRDQIGLCVGTGYGREKIPFVAKTASEIRCHALGAKWLVPNARTVIDIGGQDCKTMTIDADGQVERFMTNDKCASGTGRFLEVMARALGIGIEELGNHTRLAKSPVTLAANCTVWAQADVINYLNNGIPVEDIGAGINTAMASRVAVLVNAVRPDGTILITGGVAKNQGVVSTLEKLIGRRIKKTRKADPQLAGAIGAACLALSKAR